MKKPSLSLIGWIATATSIAMYLSYIDQIRLNLVGEHGSIIQPLAATVNCTLWVALGMLRTPRDWPVAIVSMPGILLGALPVATAL